MCPVGSHPLDYVGVSLPISCSRAFEPFVCKMKRAAVLARRLAAAASRAQLSLCDTLISTNTANGGRSSRAAVASAAASAAVLATAHWALAEAAQQPQHKHQQDEDGQEDACKECPEGVQLEEQPVAISNSATAQASRCCSGLWLRAAAACTPGGCTLPVAIALALGHAVRCSSVPLQPFSLGKRGAAVHDSFTCITLSPPPTPQQWRVFTDMGRELVQQGRHGEAERYFKKAVEMARWVRCRGWGIPPRVWRSLA